jgi:hypothetical protein
MEVLADRQPVGIGERAVLGRLAVAAGSERHALARVGHVGRTPEMLRGQPINIDEHDGQRQAPGQWEMVTLSPSGSCTAGSARWSSCRGPVASPPDLPAPE